MEILEISPDYKIEFFEYQPCYRADKAHFTIGFRRVQELKRRNLANLNIGHITLCVDPNTPFKCGTKPVSVPPPNPEAKTEEPEILPEDTKHRVEFTCGKRREYFQSDEAKHLRRSDAVQRQLQLDLLAGIDTAIKPTAPQEERQLTDYLSSLNITDSIDLDYMQISP